MVSDRIGHGWIWEICYCFVVITTSLLNQNTINNIMMTSSFSSIRHPIQLIVKNQGLHQLCLSSLWGWYVLLRQLVSSESCPSEEDESREQHVEDVMRWLKWMNTDLYSSTTCPHSCPCELQLYKVLEFFNSMYSNVRGLKWCGNEMCKSNPIITCDVWVECHNIFLRHMGCSHPLTERGMEPLVTEYETPIKVILSTQHQLPPKCLNYKFNHYNIRGQWYINHASL